MSKLKNISTNKAPSAIGAYSQGIRAGKFIFISGQIPLDPSTMEIVSDDVTRQVDQVLINFVIGECVPNLWNHFSVFVGHINHKLVMNDM